MHCLPKPPNMTAHSSKVLTQLEIKEQKYKIELISLTQGFSLLLLTLLCPFPIQTFTTVCLDHYCLSLIHVPCSSLILLNPAWKSYQLKFPKYYFVGYPLEKKTFTSPNSKLKVLSLTIKAGRSLAVWLPLTKLLPKPYLPEVIYTNRKYSPINFSTSTPLCFPNPWSCCQGLPSDYCQTKYDFSHEPAPSSPPASDSAPSLR